MTRRRLGIAVACSLLLALAMASPAASQAPPEVGADALEIVQVEDADHPTVELTVRVPSQVSDTALSSPNFEVREDDESRGQPSLGTTGTDTQEPAPPRSVLAIDTSNSMRNDIDLAKQAAADFVESMRVGSEVAVVTFGVQAQVLSDFTADQALLLERISTVTVDADIGTALFDGLLLANGLLADVPDDAPQNIVVLADGDDTVAADRQEATVNTLDEGGATVWAVALQTNTFRPDTLEALAGDRARVLSAADATQLEGIYTSLATSLSREYLLWYDSEATGETTITVDLKGTVTATDSITTVLEAAPAQRARQTPVASPDPFTVRVPLLGTAAAFTVGMAALGLAVVLFVVVLLAPRAPGRHRLVAASARPEQQLSAIAEWVTAQTERRLRDRQLGNAADRALERAGLDIRAGEFVVGVLSMMVVAFAVGVLLAGTLLGIALAILVPVAARLILGVLRDRRQAAFADQFIDVLQLLAGNLRAGYGMLQGIDAVVNDTEDPAASEFRRILLEHRLGRDLNEAMDNCADRMDNDDFRWVVQAIAIHREVGGDLARVLDNIVHTVRERAAMQRQVRALSAEGRMSSWVLSALPIVTVLLIQLTSPQYMEQMTTSTIGVVLLVVAVVMLLVGIFVVRRLVKINY